MWKIKWVHLTFLYNRDTNNNFFITIELFSLLIIFGKPDDE